jgi:tetratricopeptide (TPR) repeat protein
VQCLRNTSVVARPSSRRCKRLLSLIALLSFLAISVPSLGVAEQQGKAARAKQKAISSASADLSSELQSRVQALESAKRSEDAAAVSNASRSVLAMGLREFARTERLQGSTSSAIEDYRRSLNFEDSSATRVDLAEAYLQASRLDDCLSLLTDILVANPDDARAWYVHGKLWMTKKKYDEAVKSFTHALDLQSDPAASYLLGAALLQLREYDRAKVAFDLLKEKAADRASLHLSLAEAYRVANYMEDSARELRMAGPRVPAHRSSALSAVIANATTFGSSFEDSKPSSQQRLQIKRQQVNLRTLLANALEDLGTAEARQEKYDLALAHFHESAHWDPNIPGLLRNTGIAAGRAQDYPECVRALRPVVTKNPQDNVARSMLGTALFATHSYAEASEVFAPLGYSALQVHEIAYSWAASLVQTNKYAAATELLNKLEQQPLSTETLILAAQLWSRMGDYEHTVQLCHRALQVDPKLLRAHYIAGQSLLRLNRAADATQEFREELQLDPDNPDVQFHLAFSLLQQSQTEPAVELLKTVVARKPDHAEANYELGKELLTEGRANESLSYLEAAVRLKPQFEPAHYQLQSAYRTVGRKEDADREAKVYRALKEKSRNITLPPPPQSSSNAVSPK